MVNAQQWLTDKYELPGYDGVAERQKTLSINHPGINGTEKLEGSLEVKDFPKLQTLSLPWHKITSVKIVNCPELRTVNFMNNELTNYEVDTLYPSKKISEINLSGNNFTKVSSIKLSAWDRKIEELSLLDNNFEAQDLSEIKNLIIGTGIKKLDLGCSEEGIRKGKHNQFFGSLKSLTTLGGGSGKQLDLDISGTDINEGLDDLFRYYHWGRISLKCLPLRPNDKVKELYDQLGQPPGNGITLDKDSYQNLLKKQKEQQEEAKKWEPVKNQYQSILTQINSSTCWEAIKLYDSFYQIKTPAGDFPQEVADLLHQARMKTHELIKKFFAKLFKGEVKKEDVTDQQLEILEKEIIPFEQRLNEHFHQWDWINDQVYQDNVKSFETAIQAIQKERTRRANPQDNSAPNGGNNSDPLFGNAPINLPTTGKTPPPTHSPTQGNPDKNSPSKNIPNPAKNDNNSQGPTKQQNDDKINQSKNIEEARNSAKQIITQLFQATSVKLGDLDKSLWKNYESWEKYLETLTDKQAIASFVENFRKNIAAKQSSQNSQSNKKGGGNTLLVLSLLGIFLLVVIAVIVIIRNKKRTQKRIRSSDYY